MKLEQAARQALEALEEIAATRYPSNWCEALHDEITALREALAEQAEQEPVAWFVQYKDCHTFVWGRKPEFIVDGVVEPLYAAPVRTKDLTDDELASACGWKLGDPMYEWVVDIGRWAIAADREKNK